MTGMTNDRREQGTADTALIGVDWGTTMLRAYRLSPAGDILERVTSDQGILHVKNAAFAATLESLIGPWRAPGLPVILSGMIGSRQGWIEVPYLNMPIAAGDLAKALHRHPDDGDLFFVPGLALDQKGQTPDVMRGEETQMVGALAGARGRHLLIMTGTHAKWALVEAGMITWFATFMTGEVFALLKQHSILGRLMRDDGAAQHEAAFERGLDQTSGQPGGLLQLLFSARSLPLFDRLADVEVAPYLSGLLIGTEVREALDRLPTALGRITITVVGGPALAGRYHHALAHAGQTSTMAGEETAALGHYRIAAKAALITNPSDRPHD